MSGRCLGLGLLIACGACGDDGGSSRDTAAAEVIADGTADVADSADSAPDAADIADSADSAPDAAADIAPHEVVDDSRPPFAGAGVTGGEIAGKVTVFVMDALRGGGLAGATVRATWGATSASAITDAGGRAQLTADVAAPVALEVVADGFGFRVLYGVHAAIVVVPLWDLGQAEGYATGSYSGKADLSALPAAPVGGVRAGFAYPVFASVLGATPVDFDRARDGSPWLERMTVADASGSLFDTYHMSVYPDQSFGVVVVGGTIAGDLPAYPFDVSHVGFALAAVEVGGDVAMPAIAVDVPVDEPIAVSLATAPYTERYVSSWMRLEGGQFVLVATAPVTNATAFTAKTVAAEGPFKGARRLYWIDTYNNAGTRGASVLIASNDSAIAADDFLPEPIFTSDGATLTTKVPPYVDVRSVAVSADGLLVGTITFTRDPRGVNATTAIVPPEVADAFAAATTRSLTVVDFYARGLDRTDAPPGRLAAMTTKTAVMVVPLP